MSPDGLLLTAAHVVQSREVTVRLRDGVSRPAIVLRRAPNKDAALLLVSPRSGAPGACLDVESASKTVGADVYAIGSPASEQLAFSLTRGILSGVRIIDGS